MDASITRRLVYLSDVMKNSVVEVRRISSTIIIVKLVTEEGPLTA